MEACDQQIMWTYEHVIIKLSMHMNIKAYKQVDMFSSKHVDMGAYNN